MSATTQGWAARDDGATLIVGSRPRTHMTQGAALADEVLKSIRRILRRISEHSKQLSRDVGLTVPQLMCMRAVAAAEGGDDDVTIARVSADVQLSAGTVSRIIDRLQRAGMVRRERGKTDRRRVSLSLTDLGRERFQTLPVPLQEQFIARFGALDQAERQAILQALRRTAQLMDAEGIDAAPMLTPESSIKRDG